MKKFKALFFVSVLAGFSTGLFAQSSAENQKRDAFVSSAKSYLGTPYVWGGTSRSGLDCSGFIYCSARDAGLGAIPRTAQLIHNSTTRINKSALSKGDLIFFTEGGGKVSHVAIWLGDNSQFIHASSDGRETGVIISKLQGDNYWTKHFFDCGRLIGKSTDAVSGTGGSSNSKKSASTTVTGSSSSSLKLLSFKKRKKTKSEWSVALEFDGLVDWVVFELNDDTNHFDKNFDVPGGEIGFQFRTNLFEVDPGFMIKAVFNKNSNTFEVPVCAAANFKYGSLYGGVSIPVYLKSSDKTVHGSDFELSQSRLPIMGGFQLHTPNLTFGQNNFSLVQDVSFTYYTAEKNQSSLSANEILNEGLRFSTGIKFTLK